MSSRTDSTDSSSPDLFDQNAQRYLQELNLGLRYSGESAQYFADHRVQVSAAIFDRLVGGDCRSILDYGCGIGTANPFLAQQFPQAEITGFDVAGEAIQLAADKFPSSRWISQMQDLSADSFDLVYCNGVFHHIEPGQRDRCLLDITRVMKPGGLFCLWENNPWNPGTRWIMSRVPFDRDAICLPPTETWNRLLGSGLVVRERQFHFWFPRALSWLRGLERWLVSVPLGGQYVVVGQKKSNEKHERH